MHDQYGFPKRVDALQHFPSQCQLVLNGSVLQLNPCNGNKLFVRDQIISLPGGTQAWTLPTTGLSNSTLYYIYASARGLVALSSASFSHTPDLNTGMEVLSSGGTADPYLTLVGMAYIDGSGTFKSSGANQLVASWFNRQSKTSVAAVSVNRTTASTAWVELNAELQAAFVNWASSEVYLHVSGSVSNNTTNVISQTAVSLDSSGTPLASVGATITAVNGPMSIGLFCVTSPTEGRHFSSMLAAVNGGTGTWYSGDGANATSGTVRNMVRLYI